MSEKKKRVTLGWREWVSLPDLGLDNIKAKIDTGARTSALHAFDIHVFDEAGVRKVEFSVQPNQTDEETVVRCVADIVDERDIRDSGGHQQRRLVINTPITIGEHTWPAEVTLTTRSDMKFRMLLGRTAMKGRAMVNPSRSYVTSGRKGRGKG